MLSKLYTLLYYESSKNNESLNKLHSIDIVFGRFAKNVWQNCILSYSQLYNPTIR